jgi:hypothetical protein
MLWESSLLNSFPRMWGLEPRTGEDGIPRRTRMRVALSFIALLRNLTESYLWSLGNISQRPPSLARFQAETSGL